ncbi:MAG: septum formation initiator family protein [Acidobacteria bacterium]|nr:septum formation initiator family protein [Acidobacteriota bacterium]
MKRLRAPKIAVTRRNMYALLAVVVATLFVHDLFGDRGFFAMRRNQQQVEKISMEIQQVDAENQRLAIQIKGLKSDPATIERIAREEMNLARPGEMIFKLPPRETEKK